MRARALWTNHLRGDHRDPACALRARNATHVAGVDLQGMHGFRWVGNDFVDIDLLMQEFVDAALHFRFKLGPMR